MTAPTIFTRKATGLVRDAGAFDTVAYNVFFGSPWVAMLFCFLIVPSFLPGADLILSTIICFILVLPMIASYALLAGAIPRSGGEYTYVSRILHPAIGVMANINVAFFGIVFVGIAGAWFAQWGIALFLRVAGSYTGNTSLLDLSATVATNEAKFILGTILIVLYTLLFMRGLRAYFTYQRVIFTICAAALVLGVLVLLVGDPTTYPNSFNTYALPLTGNANTYQAVQDAATSADFAPAPTNLVDSIRAVDWVFLALGYTMASAYIGGEVRRPASSQLIGMVGATAVGAVILIIYFFLMNRVIGNAFIGASGVGAVDAGMPDTPIFVELIASISSNAILWLPMTLAFVFWPLATMPINMLMATRSLLAYSLDGLVPHQLSEVSDRSHAPVAGLLFVAAFGIFWLWIYIFTTYTSVILLIFANVLTYLTTAVAAALLPYRRPQLYESSPIARRWVGVPTITIVGVLGIITMVVMGIIILNDPVSGFSFENPYNLVFNVVVYLLGGVYYLGAKFIQRARGVNIDNAYREIPVE
jgi:amino acid transporter